jgi:hypothetical protein
MTTITLDLTGLASGLRETTVECIIQGTCAFTNLPFASEIVFNDAALVSAFMTITGIGTYGGTYLDGYWTSGSLTTNADGTFVRVDVIGVAGFHQLHANTSVGNFQLGVCPGSPCGSLVITNATITYPVPAPIAGETPAALVALAIILCAMLKKRRRPVSVRAFPA